MNTIPNKFCINFKKVGEKKKYWFKDQINNCYNNNSYCNSNDTIYHFEDMKSIDTGESFPKEGYTLITFEDFERIILNPNQEPQYEIY